MKHTKQFMLAVLAATITTTTFAQNWAVGGNNLGGGGAERLFGITGPNTKNLVFINGNVGGVPIERGRIASTGFWGIGTTNPNARLHINSAAGETPFRVQINGSSKLVVNSNGGTTIGSTAVAQDNGLHVTGNMNIGTPGANPFNNTIRLHVVGGGTNGFIVAGDLNGPNVAIDDDGIRARDNGFSSTLYLNAGSGSISMRQGAIYVNGVSRFVGINNLTPDTELHLQHEIGGGSTNGLRIENLGPNDHQWTFYVQNSTGTLDLVKNGSYRGSFDDVSGAYSSVSDARLKKNIEGAGTLLPKILQLDIKKYHFLQNANTDKKHYGMLAQEVEKIFPEVIKHDRQDDGKDIYTMDYASFGVLAIKAIQEQQQLIETLRIQNENLESRLKKLENAKATSSNASDIVLPGKGAAILEQNTPNPFNQTTTIRYHIPDAANAAITVYNGTGAPVKTIKANASGIATINAGELAAGAYTYTLVMNGKTVASKKMLLVK